MTKKQLELLEILKKERKHLTAEEVFLLAKQNNMKISLASVYRILGVLTEEGQIKKVSNLYKQDAYDVFMDNHEHLVCSKCGRITDIEIPDFKQTLAKYANVDIQDFDLCIHYVCDDCKKKEEK